MGRQTKYLHSRQVLPRPNLKEIITQGSISRSDQLRLNKTQLRNLIEAITGHCLLNKHLSHWKEIESTKCRLCEEDDETYLHLINECPAMELERRQIFEPPYNNADIYFRDIKGVPRNKYIISQRYIMKTLRATEKLSTPFERCKQDLSFGGCHFSLSYLVPEILTKTWT